MGDDSEDANDNENDDAPAAVENIMRFDQLDVLLQLNTCERYGSVDMKCLSF
jgi:hypothetical protein